MGNGSRTGAVTTHGIMGSRSAWRLILAVLVVAQFVVLYAPSTGGPSTDLPLDKVVHFLIFGVVAFAGVVARVPTGWLVGLLVVQAVGSELIQHWWLSERGGDPADAVADLLGVAAGVLLGRRVLTAQMRPGT